MTGFTVPERLTPDHQLADFACGNAALDSWFRDRALRNEVSGASRSYVTRLRGGEKVAGFYTLAASSVLLADAPGSVSRNMPSPIPVILLGRLAVDAPSQGVGLGASLLQDAVLRVTAAAESVGVRAMLVHAIDDAAVAFYQHFGFAPSPLDDKTLFLSLPTIRKSATAAVLRGVDLAIPSDLRFARA